MKILIINSSDIDGGAARAAYRLHKALLSERIDSTMLVQRKNSDDWSVIGARSKKEMFINLLRPTLDVLPVRFYKDRTKTLFSPAWSGNKSVLKMIQKLNPDIVHLHWICGGMLKIEDISKIKKPIVWTLHDNWVFTGGCHIMWECKRYIDSCGACPRLGSDKEHDLSRRVWLRKKKTFTKIDDLTIVGLSNWIFTASKESSLLKDKRHINLPNLIDTTIFKPHDKTKSRELWNLPKDKKLILFGAMSATSDINKGFKELSQAFEQLTKDDIEFVVFGSSTPKNPPKSKFKTHFVGHLHDDVSLVTLYSAVDVMVVPSLQENLSNVIMESLSCSIPVVAFDVGGNADLIEHKKNGYLAKPFETKELANGIEWVLNQKNYDKICVNAREKVLKEFDSRVVTQKYIELYKEILDESK